MQPLDIPGFGTLAIENLILDFNGTLALDGRLIDGVSGRIETLSRSMNLHVLTADTHGFVEKEMCGCPCKVEIVPPGVREDQAKLAFIKRLGAETCAAVGNGAIDAPMLEAARLGICVVGTEGAAGISIMAADLVVTGPLDALDLLIKPERLIAGLRR